MGSPVERIVKPRIEGSCVVWTGASGIRYQTTIEPIGGNFVALPGVYIFCDYQQDRVRPVYVGHTDNLERRLTSDLSWTPRWREIVTAGAHFVCSLPVEKCSDASAFIARDLQDGIAPALLDN